MKCTCTEYMFGSSTHLLNTFSRLCCSFRGFPLSSGGENPVVWREASYASDCLSAVKPTPTTAPVSADQDGSPAASLRPSAFFLVHLPYFQCLS